MPASATLTEARPKLTPRQKNILRFIAWYTGEYGAPPTLRAICVRFDISSPNGVMCHLRALVQKGYVERADKGQEYGKNVNGEKRIGACGYVIPELVEAAQAASAAYMKTLGK